MLQETIHEIIQDLGNLAIELRSACTASVVHESDGWITIDTPIKAANAKEKSHKQWMAEITHQQMEQISEAIWNAMRESGVSELGWDDPVASNNLEHKIREALTREEKAITESTKDITEWPQDVRHTYRNILESQITWTSGIKRLINWAQDEITAARRAEHARSGRKRAATFLVNVTKG